MACPFVQTASNVAIRFSALQAVVCFCVASTIDAAIGLYQFKALIHGALINPDNYMRLVRLDEIIRQHAR
jgi:hypothetical protein